MPIGREFKKFTKKLPREIGRIIKQTGQVVKDSTDIDVIIEIGEDLETEGLSIMDKANKKLLQITSPKQINEVLPDAHADNLTQQQGQADDFSASSQQVTNPVVKEENTFIEDLYEQAEVRSISSSSSSLGSAISLLQDVELTEAFQVAEAQSQKNNQVISNMDSENVIINDTNDKEQEGNVQNNSTSNVHLVFSLRSV